MERGERQRQRQRDRERVGLRETQRERQRERDTHRKRLTRRTVPMSSILILRASSRLFLPA